MRKVLESIVCSIFLVSCASTTIPLSDREFAAVKETKAAKYPVIAATEGIEGEVTLQFDVSKEGNVENISILKAKPQNIFDRAAIMSLSDWKFYPKVVNGTAVSSREYTITLEFNLEN